MQEYKPRLVDTRIKLSLEAMGALVIQGPKWCGKTTTGEHHSRSSIFLDDPDRRAQYEILGNTQVSLLLEGDTPRLIDEWELIPQIWDAVRHTVDKRRKPGQFILTGSAKPVDRTKIYHSGTGRFSWIMMRPMSLFESGDSTGQVSLNKLFNNDYNEFGCLTESDLLNIAYLACRGGWPLSVTLKPDMALVVAKDYYEAIVNVDINRVDNTIRNPRTARTLMRSYARFQGTQTPVTTITADMNDADLAVDEQTVRNYLDALRNLFVIEDMPAWNPNLKSKSAIRTTDTRYFIDPSIACASLHIGPNDLIKDLKTFGFIFEALCVRDLRVYSQILDGDVYHYRDKNGLECDCVIHLHDGRYGLIEIKLGGEKLIEEGAKNLIKLKEKINREKMGEPAFEMIIVAVGGAAYKRKDGILVVPINCLRD